MKQRCTYCGSNAHTADFCPKTSNGQGNRQSLKCSYCGSKKHNLYGCPKLRTNPGPNAVCLAD